MAGLVAAFAAAGAVLLVGARRPASEVRFALPAAALVVGAAVVMVVALEVPVPLVLLALAVVYAARREVVRRRLRAERERRSEAALELCEGLAADLRAGLPPLEALRIAAAEWPEVRPVLAAARLGGEVPDALRELAGRPGAEALNAVAAAWVVAHRSGAGLAAAVELAAATMREERATHRVVETELAAARATAKMLAVLPAGVLLLGRGTGGDPFAFLLTTTAGLVCLAIGLVLDWLGLAWLERIGRSVLR